MLVEILTSISPTSWCVLLALFLLLIWQMTSPSHPNLPPSPSRPLPIIGHMHLVHGNPREQFRKWGEQLGDVFSLRFGSIPIIVFNSYDTMKEALVKQADIFSDRPSNFYINKRFPWVLHGILTSSGQNWKTQRTTSLNILRNFGMGKNILAEKIAEEVAIFLKELGKSKGKPQDLREITNLSVSNNICSIIFGQRFEFDDPKFVEMINVFNELVLRLSGTNVLDFLPFLRYLPFDLFGCKAIDRSMETMHNFVTKMVEEKKKEYDPANLDNFIVAYIDEVRKSERSGIETTLDETKLLNVVDNLFIAGTETTSTTMLWCILYCLHYPQIQEKIYQEIVREVGTERPPNMLDKPKLKYLNAAIMETQRIASILPLDLPHLCSQNTTINGYHIPEGATIIPNLDSILLDKKIWGDPEVFRPERFLDKDGNLIKKEELVPFSLGRRLCLGEGLARMELYLYLAALIQKFEFRPDDPADLPPAKSLFGTTCPPLPFKVRCVARNV